MIILVWVNNYLILALYMLIYAVFHTVDKRKASQAEQSSDQNSHAEILEEKIDLAREQVLHRYVI